MCVAQEVGDVGVRHDDVDQTGRSRNASQGRGVCPFELRVHPDRKEVEERRVVIRNLRREAVDELRDLEKNKDISQDEYKRALDQLQKLTDIYIINTERIGQAKEVELMEI